MDSYYLALVLDGENRNQIPHPYQVNKIYNNKLVTKSILEKMEKYYFFSRKKLLRDFISMKKILTVQEVKKYFPRGTRLKDISDFVLRNNYYVRHGEQKFFERFYPNFYQKFQQRAFWGSHYLNDI